MLDKDFWQLVARHLGLELNEEFTIGHFKAKFRFSEKGLQEESPNEVWTETGSTLLGSLLQKKLKIHKLPWKPKKGERYYYIDLGGRGSVYPCPWEGDEFDEATYAICDCFKTRKEAEEKLQKILEVLNNER